MLDGGGRESRSHRRCSDYGGHGEEDVLDVAVVDQLFRNPSGGTSNSRVDNDAPPPAKDEQCLRSDSGPAEQTGRREDTRLGWVERKAMRAARFRNAAGGCGVRMGAAVFGGGSTR